MRERNIDWLPLEGTPTRTNLNPGKCPDQNLTDLMLRGMMPNQLNHAGWGSLFISEMRVVTLVHLEFL